MNNTPRHVFEVSPLTEQEGGGFLVTFPDLPGCMADGATPEEALAEAADAEISWLMTREELGAKVGPRSCGPFAAEKGMDCHVTRFARSSQ